MVEVWRAVRGFEHSYLVSNWGNVCSVDQSRISKTGHIISCVGSIIRPALQAGTPYVQLNGTTLRLQAALSHLVADAFCHRRNDQMSLTHIDGNRLNNRAENLLWDIGDTESEPLAAIDEETRPAPRGHSLTRLLRIHNTCIFNASTSPSKERVSSGNPTRRATRRAGTCIPDKILNSHLDFADVVLISMQRSQI